MDWVKMVLVIVAASIHGGSGDTMVSGTVFCDQCKDGQITTLLDYPLGGVRVLMACPGETGQFTLLREETTNWLGTYTTTFAGTLDMSSCRAQVSGNGQGCGATVGPAQDFRLRYRMFDTEVYTVDPLIAQPAQPLPFCPQPTYVPTLLPPPVYLPPSVNCPPSGRQSPPVPPLPPLPSLPPLPPLPPIPPFPVLPPMPAAPMFEASACPYQMWMMPQHKCYWNVLSPDLKVSNVFGQLASTTYGTDITLHESMYGRGDPFRTLLREGTTALLNSYNSGEFAYQPPEVIQCVNNALVSGSTRQVLMTALQFILANSGQTGNVTCKFTACA